MSMSDSSFWKEYIDNCDDPRSIRINGTHYVIGDEDPTILMRGYGGAKFHLRNIETGEEVFTTNLWCQGDIPVEYRHLLYDNAEMVPIKHEPIIDWDSI